MFHVDEKRRTQKIAIIRHSDPVHISRRLLTISNQIDLKQEILLLGEVFNQGTKGKWSSEAKF